MPDINEIRQMVPGVLDTTYLNTGTCGPMPKVAYDAMMEEFKKDLTGYRIQGHFERIFELWGEVREAVAPVLGADPSEIAITTRTTDGMFTTIMGYPWNPGDELIISNIEHPGGIVPSFLARQRFGIRVKVADVELGGGTPDEVAAKFERMITPRTRMIAISHVTYTTGALLPLKEIVEMAHQHDVLVAVDAAQSYGPVPIDVHDTGVDFYACPGQKWMCGPDGTGALYVRADRLGEINQNHGGMLVWDSIDYHGRTYQPAPDASKFDTGGWSRGLLAGQVAATNWVMNDVGLDWAQERIESLSKNAYDQLAEMDGVTMVTPREAMAGLLAFTVDGVEPPELTERLLEDHNVTIRHVNRYINNPDASRISVGFYNNEEDIEKLIDSLDQAREKLQKEAASA